MTDQPAPTPTRIVLVRHGESEAQAGRFVGGHEGCKGLTDRGRRQVDALRERLQRTGELSEATAFYTSVLPRAIETAAIMAPALGGLEAVQDCTFCEQHPGEADGITWDEYMDRYRQGRTGFDPFVPDAPGQETWAEMIGRVGRALSSIADRHAGETAVVACHGGVVASSMISRLGIPVTKPVWELEVDNASITEWEVVEGRWRLVRYNDHAHITGL